MNLRAGLLAVAAVAASLWLGCSSNSKGPIEPPPVRPAAAADLFVTQLAPTSIELAWSDRSDDETGFRVERAAGGTTAFARLDTVAANVEIYVDRSVTADASYSYRVFSYRKLIDADQPSNSVSASAITNNSPTTPTPSSPADGAVELDPTATLTLNWHSTDADADAVTYDLFFGPSRGSLSAVGGALTDTSWTVNVALSRNSAYFWKVIAHDTKGVSSPSPIWGFVTKVDRESIPFGPFAMGPDTTEASLRHPGSPVLVSDFNIDRYEVTNAQFAAYLNQALERELIIVRSGQVLDTRNLRVLAEVYSADPTKGDVDSSIRFLAGEKVFEVRDGRDAFPVNEVSWYGADSFARFYGRRLPSEAEWEKAARGTSKEFGFELTTTGDTVGVGFRYPWGNSAERNRGNFSVSGDPYENAGRVASTPVGFYDGSVRAGGYQTMNGASPYGLYDMAGNLWEWTNDPYGPYRRPHSPPRPEDSNAYVVRGGSYGYRLSTATTWNRTSLPPDITDAAVGFRTAAAGVLSGN